LRLTVANREWQVEIRDPREWRRNRSGVAEAEGRQQVLAPMPGKIVRVLVGAGDAVEAKQGLLVVEAMKMQNEIRSPKSGTVERLLVNEGQTVNAGEVLAIIS
jgi:biotin carboxyl carrier protein